MLFFKALPLSLSITLRFIPYLPLLIVILVLYYVLAAVIIILGGLLSPFVAGFLGIGMALGAGVIPVMIGTRLGLEFKGVTPISSYVGLLLPATLYGLVEAIVFSLIVAAAVGAFFLISPMTIEDVKVLIAAASDVETDTGLLSNSDFILMNVLVAVIGILMCLLRAALLLPHASASVARDPDGGYFTPMRGFATAFAPLAVLVFFAYVGISVFMFALGLAASALGQGVAFASTIESFQRLVAFDFSALSDIGWGGALLAVLIFVVGLWSFSVQCAGAVMVYLRLQDYAEEEKAEAMKLERMDSEDVRALWKSRM